MTTKAKGRSATILALALLAIAGCIGTDDPDPDPGHAREFGLGSIKSAYVQVIHRDDRMDILLTADLIQVDSTPCPPLVSDLTITANGEPLRLSLYDFSDSFSFGCTARSVDGAATISGSGGPLRLEFSQGSRAAIIEVADVVWPTFGPVTISATELPLGGPFTVDIGVSPAEDQWYANPGCWRVSTCPAKDPSCTGGYGWSGFTIKESSYADGHVRLETAVPDIVTPVVTPGDRLLTVESSSYCTLAPRMTQCSGLPSCVVINTTTTSKTFGPFPLTVTE